MGLSRSPTQRGGRGQRPLRRVWSDRAISPQRYPDRGPSPERQQAADRSRLAVGQGPWLSGVPSRRGVGSAEDSLFHFKAGFSDRRHPYHTWQVVFLDDVYESLTARRREAGAATIRQGFFPAYRA